MIELEKRASWYFRMSSEQTTKNLETAKEIEGIIRQKWSCSGNHCHTGWSPIHRSSHRGVGVACKVWSPNPKNCSMRHSCCRVAITISMSSEVLKNIELLYQFISWEDMVVATNLDIIYTRGAMLSWQQAYIRLSRKKLWQLPIPKKWKILANSIAS
ncbi:uncharacterized protein LOC141644130 isoform X1 [Silene latifolia]|uniref:uncharacterized protein LOC141644130 isoform X1 n=1 Tax=Silene latifolia TaxID=37657 RepID=UPI003D775D34